MMTLEQIHQRQRAELAARLDGLNTNHDKSEFRSFPTWQAAASALLG